MIYMKEEISAFDRAAKKLGCSMMTEKETADYLRGKGFASDEIKDAVCRLKEYNYLGDGEYVKAYFNSHAGKKGDKGIRYELERKGIAAELIAEFFDESESDEAERCKAVAEKYMRNKEKTEKTKAGLARHLYSRGFAWDTASKVVAVNFHPVVCDDTPQEGN